MSKLKRVRLSFCVTLLTLVAVGCAVRISKITADPAKYMNREVTISGTVTESYGALGTGAYEVDDGSGRMWVISERFGVPSKGAKVRVTGRVIPTATFGGRTFANALQQTERRD